MNLAGQVEKYLAIALRLDGVKEVSLGTETPVPLSKIITNLELGTWLLPLLAYGEEGTGKFFLTWRQRSKINFAKQGIFF